MSKPAQGEDSPGKLDVLERTVKKIVKEIKSLKEQKGPDGKPVDVSGLQAEIAALKQSQATLTSEVEELKQDNHKLKKNLIALSKLVKGGAGAAGVPESGPADAAINDMEGGKRLREVHQRLDMVSGELEKLKNVNAAMNLLKERIDGCADAEEVKKIKRAVIALKNKISNGGSSAVGGEIEDDDNLKKVINDLRTSRRAQDVKVQQLDRALQAMKPICAEVANLKKSAADVEKIKRVVVQLKKKVLAFEPGQHASPKVDLGDDFGDAVHKEELDELKRELKEVKERMGRSAHRPSIINVDSIPRDGGQMSPQFVEKIMELESVVDSYGQEIDALRSRSNDYALRGDIDQLVKAISKCANDSELQKVKMVITKHKKVLEQMSGQKFDKEDDDFDDLRKVKDLVEKMRADIENGEVGNGAVMKLKEKLKQTRVMLNERIDEVAKYGSDLNQEVSSMKFKIEEQKGNVMEMMKTVKDLNKSFGGGTDGIHRRLNQLNEDLATVIAEIADLRGGTQTNAMSDIKDVVEARIVKLENIVSDAAVAQRLQLDMTIETVNRSLKETLGKLQASKAEEMEAMSVDTRDMIAEFKDSILLDLEDMREEVKRDQGIDSVLQQMDEKIEIVKESMKAKIKKQKIKAVNQEMIESFRGSMDQLEADILRQIENAKSDIRREIPEVPHITDDQIDEIMATAKAVQEAEEKMQILSHTTAGPLNKLLKRYKTLKDRVGELQYGKDKYYQMGMNESGDEDDEEDMIPVYKPRDFTHHAPSTQHAPAANINTASLVQNSDFMELRGQFSDLERKVSRLSGLEDRMDGYARSYSKALEKIELIHVAAGKPATDGTPIQVNVEQGEGSVKLGAKVRKLKEKLKDLSMKVGSGGGGCSLPQVVCDLPRGSGPFQVVFRSG